MNDKCFILYIAHCSLVVISALGAVMPSDHVYTGQTTPFITWQYIFHHVLFYSCTTYHVGTCASWRARVC